MWDIGVIERKQIIGKALAVAPLSSALVLATTFSVASQTSEGSTSDNVDMPLSAQEETMRGGAERLESIAAGPRAALSPAAGGTHAAGTVAAETSDGRGRKQPARRADRDLVHVADGRQGSASPAPAEPRGGGW